MTGGWGRCCEGRESKAVTHLFTFSGVIYVDAWAFFFSFFLMDGRMTTLHPA